mmetsp:Transcript_10633/g.43002  ORF Transcript_10633/g.43002 Transcript_10633/m.43002 type:complete len:259 (-) Transcript_10633:46-822(-)
MNVPTYRRGRRRATDDDAGACGGILTFIVLVAALIAVPLIVASVEAAHATRVAELCGMLDVGFAPLTAAVEPGQLVWLVVHGGSSKRGSRIGIEALSRDEDFGVAVAGALALRRETRYCQWTEHSRRHCQTYEREVRAKDGSRTTETYGCDCVVEYSYVKSWLPHRVPSAFFDQPAMHHNPQRDPYPSRTFRAKEAVLEADDGSVRALLDGGVLARGARAVASRRVDRRRAAAAAVVAGVVVAPRDEHAARLLRVSWR